MTADVSGVQASPTPGLSEQQLHYLAVAMTGFARNTQPTYDSALDVLRQIADTPTFRNAGVMAAETQQEKP